MPNLFDESLTQHPYIYAHYLSEYTDYELEVKNIQSSKISEVCNLYELCDHEIYYDSKTDIFYITGMYDDTIVYDYKVQDINFKFVKSDTDSTSKKTHTIDDKSEISDIFDTLLFNINDTHILWVKNKKNHIDVFHFNSSDDMENHGNYNTYYKPYIWHRIEMKDKSNEDRMNIIISLLLLKQLYNMTFVRFALLKKIIDFLTKYLNSDILIFLSEIDYEITSENKTYKLNDFLEHIKTNDIGNNYVNITTKTKPSYSMYITRILQQYTIFTLKNHYDKSFSRTGNLNNINNLQIDNIHKPNDVIFHYDDTSGDVYVSKHSTNASLWFCIYWINLFDNIYNNNNRIYKEFITNCDNKFKTIIKQIFTKETYELKLISSSKIHTFINLWEKFIRIGILDKNSKINFNDDTSKILIDSLKYSGRKKNTELSTIFTGVLIDNIFDIFQKGCAAILTHFIEKYDDVIPDRNYKIYTCIDKHILFMYKLFSYIKITNLDFFNNNVMECKYDQLKSLTDPKNHNQYEKLIIYLKKYKQLNTNTIIQYDIIYKYYFYAKYIYGLCDAYKDYDSTKISNIDLNNDSLMYEFCVFLHKFELFMFSMMISNNIYVRQTTNKHILPLFFNNNLEMPDKLYELNSDVLKIYKNYYFPSALFYVIPPNTNHDVFEAEYNTCDIKIFKQTIDYLLQNPSLLFSSPNKKNNQIKHITHTTIINYLIFDIKNNKIIKNKIIIIKKFI